jgi:hypothetical protein
MFVGDNDDELPLVPRRLCVEANSVEQLAEIARAVEARFHPDPAAWRVLQFASTLEAYRSSLQWRVQKDVNWVRRDFHTQSVQWLESQPDGDGLAEFTDPQTHRRDYRLRWGDRIADVDRRWGCYAALAKADRHVIFFTGDAVLAPLHARLPVPYEAGLVLCSGYAPRRVNVTPAPNGPTVYLLYRDVPRQLAELAANKLGQQLLPITAPTEAAS